MTIIRLMPGELDDRSPESIAEFRKQRLSPCAETNRESFIDKIEKNFGFVIIGIMFVGALVWTAMMFF